MKLLSSNIESPLATYAVGPPLGEGGAGIVFGATRDDGTGVAIKVLKPSATSREALKRFRNELHFCLRTADPHIVPVLDFGSVDSNQGSATFYVMPRFRGTLRTRMKAGLPTAAANALTSALLDAVEAAHLRKVWHRDLKPENFLTPEQDDQLVLSDFGAAHFHADHLVTAIETGPHDRLANFEYAAPEQRRKGSAVDHRCDLYAVGLMIHELFTGQVPHGKGHKLIGDVAPGHGHLDEIVAWLTQHSADARPASIDEVRLHLLALNRAVSARQRLAETENRVITTVESDDPLIAEPPRVVDIDVQGNILHLRLNRAVTPAWIRAFQGINYRHSLMWASPEYFSFNGTRASVPMRGNAPTPENLQRVIDDFKRFLTLAADAYAERVGRDLRETEAATREAKARQIAEERRRLDLLSKLKV